jgi:hypothetical protein
MTDFGIPEPTDPWSQWSRVTLAIEGESGITLEELYQAFKARFKMEAERRLNELSPQEKAIAERMGHAQ